MTDRTMPPVGPEMDALVGEILGWLAEEFAHPSTYAYDAWCALDEWREQHPEWSIEIDFNQPCHPGVWEVCLYDVSGEGEFTPYDAHTDTLAQAICEAIIRAHWALEDAE